MAKFSTKALTKKYDKWSGASSGYKSSSHSFGNSSFWMDDEFLTRDSSKGKSIDIMKLAAYKRAITNFVRIVTGKDDISVLYSSGKDSYTNGKSVVISSKLNEAEFDSTVGLALHEGSHIALTDFALTSRIFNNSDSTLRTLVEYMISKGFTVRSGIYDNDLIQRLKTLVNIIEDRRIDRFVYESAPGYQGYYQSLYDTYFNAKEIDEALKSRKFNNLTWEDYEFHICNFVNPNRTLDLLPGLREIWNVIDIANISRMKSTAHVFVVAEEVFKIILQHAGWGDSNVNSPSHDNPVNLGNKNQKEGQGANSIDESEENQKEGQGANSIDESEDDVDKMDNSDPDLDVSSQGASSKDAKQEAKERQSQKKLEEAIKKQKDFLNGKIKKSKLSKQDSDKINAAAESNMEYVSVAHDFNGRYSNTKKTNCMVVKGVKQSMYESDLLGTQMQSVDCYQEILETEWSNAIDYVQEGINLGRTLGKKLKTRDEDRSLKTTRMETGAIDRRLIAELGFGNDRVFNQVIHNTVTPSIVHISVDASCSMSGAKWEAAMKTAIAIAKAASMVSSLDCIISVRGSFGIYQNQTPLMWVIYDSRVTSFAQAQNHFKMIAPTGSTPEGLCYEAVMKDIIKSSNGKESFFINICDGEPGYSDTSISYGGDAAIAHTASQVKKMQAAGIKTLAYFVHGGIIYNHSKDVFRRMYGNSAEFIDVNNLTQLSQSLNKLFIRK
jgi:hypothetical protein